MKMLNQVVTLHARCPVHKLNNGKEGLAERLDTGVKDVITEKTHDEADESDCDTKQRSTNSHSLGNKVAPCPCACCQFVERFLIQFRIALIRSYDPARPLFDTNQFVQSKGHSVRKGARRRRDRHIAPP